MNVYVLNRRSLVFKKDGAGTVNVLFVPGREQIQIVRDIIGVADMPARDGGMAAKGMRLPVLSRARRGMRLIYGHLIEDVVELKQSVRVWLAEDFVDASCRAFFFVLSPSVVLHGVREADDEGQMSWRTAQLPVEGDAYTNVLNAISDYVIAQAAEGLVVAVYNQIDLYKKLQTDLAAYEIQPIPFSTLKPAPNTKPLYKHYDFTIFYMTLLLFGGIALLASAGYLLYNIISRSRLDDQIEQIRTEIQNIQLNQNMSQIRDPKAILREMGRASEIVPSSIIDAAGSLAGPFGVLTSLTYKPPVLKEGEAPPETITVTLALSGLKDRLLIDQENQAKSVVLAHPWLRSLRRLGAMGEDGTFEAVLHVGAAPEALQQGATPAFPPITEVSPATVQDISGTVIPSGTALVTVHEVSPVSPASVSPTPLQPTSGVQK